MGTYAEYYGNQVFHDLLQFFITYYMQILVQGNVAVYNGLFLELPSDHVIVCIHIQFRALCTLCTCNCIFGRQSTPWHKLFLATYSKFRSLYTATFHLTFRPANTHVLEVC